MTSSDHPTEPRSRLLRRMHLHRHPRPLGAAALAILLYFVLSGWIAIATRLLIAFDGGALFFLAAAWVMMVRATPADMRRRAQIEDEGRYTVLTLSAVVASATLLAIVFELHGIKDLPPGRAGFHIALAAGTIMLSWFFMNTMFALHYAHSYYGDGDPSNGTGGLVFPGQREPDYWDFLYFSFVIGMTFQVSDVQIEDHSLRWTALAHGVSAFFFNVVILALTINIIAGLI